MAKVSKRGGYSDRNGIKPENSEIQLKDFDKRTRIKLKNMVINMYVNIYGASVNYYNNEKVQDFIRYIWGEIYSEYIDSRKDYDIDAVFRLINETLDNGAYDDVLTLIESLVQYWDSYLHENNPYKYYGNDVSSLFDIANKCFKNEYVGYRFVDKKIVQISDLHEIETINETLKCKYQPVYEHISKATGFLANRNNPDYKNSIKESVTAVEAMCVVITGIKGKEATLSNMFKTMKSKGIEIHGSLESAFERLYGYSSDSNGIRHAGNIDGPSATFEEAKFMLVACCAFINYLIALNADR